MRSRALPALALALVSVLPAAGCYQGFNNTVNSQGPTGNGTDFAVGDLLVQDATLVASAEQPRRAAVVLTVINPGEVADALTTVTIAGTAATIRTAPIPIPSGGSVTVGGASQHQVVVTGLSVPAGSYADMEIGFRNAGTAARTIAVVPAVGYYADYGPRAAAEAVTGGSSPAPSVEATDQPAQ